MATNADTDAGRDTIVPFHTQCKEVTQMIQGVFTLISQITTGLKQGLLSDTADSEGCSHTLPGDRVPVKAVLEIRRTRGRPGAPVTQRRGLAYGLSERP